MKCAAFAFLTVMTLVALMACNHTPSMKMGYFNRPPADLSDRDYRTGNEYDDTLITGVEKVLEENKGYGQRPYMFLIRGQKPRSYAFKQYKAAHPNDLIIEYGNGRKLAVFTNDLPSADMADWDITWDATPPKLPQRIR